MGTNHETRLFERLAELDAKLADETRQLVANVEPLLARAPATFPSGTSHTAQHTRVVEMCASMLIPDAMLMELSKDELQLLILSCHFHDLGMSATVSQSITPEDQEQARRDHAVRVGSQLRKHKFEIGFRDDALIDALAEVCRGHRPKKADGKANWDDIKPSLILSPARAARIRVIAALVYAADEMHLGHDRAPEREQSWAEISNPESAKHWERHRLIAGPALSHDRVRFIVTVPTLAAESDLLKNVLMKALGAVHDSRELIRAEGIDVDLAQVEIVWNRERLWELLTVKAASDMKPRTIEKVGADVLQLYLKCSIEFVDIAELGAVVGSDEQSLLAGIRRTVSDFVCRDFLRPAGAEGLTLNVSLDAATYFFDLTKTADAIDSILKGKYAALHDFELQRSRFGALHHAEAVSPTIAKGFGIYPALPKDSPAAILLELSPTARAMAMQGVPASSMIAKPTPLALVSLAGASLDSLRQSELMLDERFRNAFKALAIEIAKDLPTFIRFVEEIALLRGYSDDQLTGVLVPSAGAIEAHQQSVGQDGRGVENADNRSITITQTFPSILDSASVAFPHLLIASQRTGYPVQFIGGDDTSLTVKEIRPDDSESESSIAAFAIGPGEGRHAGTHCERADFEFDPATRVLTFQLQQRGKDEFPDIDLPLILDIPTQGLLASRSQTPNVATTTSLTFTRYWPSMLARHWRAIRQLGEVPATDVVQSQLVAAGPFRTKGTLHTLSAEQIKLWCVAPWSAEFIDFLCEKGPDTQYPWFASKELRKAIQNGDKANWEMLFDQFSTMPTEEKLESTTVFVQLSRPDGYVYQEEYLGTFPGIRLNPSVNAADQPAEVQDKLKHQIEAGTFTLSSSFSEDVYELLREIREWTEDTSQPFPLSGSDDPPNTPAYRSRVEFIYTAPLDRFWYMERRWVIRLRPISDEERWNVEGLHWRSEGDEQREKIILERLAQLRDEAGECQSKGLVSDQEDGAVELS